MKAIADQVTGRKLPSSDSQSIAELRQKILVADKPTLVGYTPILPEDGLYLWDGVSAETTKQS